MTERGSRLLACAAALDPDKALTGSPPDAIMALLMRAAVMNRQFLAKAGLHESAPLVLASPGGLFVYPGSCCRLVLGCCCIIQSRRGYRGGLLIQEVTDGEV